MENLNIAPKTTLIIILLIGAFLFFLFYFEHNLYNRVDDSFKREFVDVEQNLLIAKPSSPFKDSIATGILEHFNASSVLIKVVDVEGLDKTNAPDFDAILIMHRWVAGAPTDIVQNFVEKNLESKNKIFLLTTSWNGLEKMENVDAITGASIMDDVPDFTNQLIARLDGILDYDN